MLFKAYKDNVFILPEKHERKYGSLFIPDTADGSGHGKRMLVGRVIDAGPGGMGEDGSWWDVDVEVGERVLVDREAGELVIIGSDIPAKLAPELEPGTELRVVRNNEIAAVIE